MKFIKYKILIFFILTPKVYANTADEFNIERVYDILSQISVKYKKYKNISIEFSSVRYDPEESDKYEKHEGTFTTKLIPEENENKYKYKLQIDDDTVIITDGETKWVYINSINEVTISDFNLEDEDEKMLNKIKNTILSPTELFAPVLYEKKETVEIIELIPYEEDNQNVDERSDESIEIDRIVLKIDSETKELKNFRIDTEDGNQITYYIENIEHDLEISDEYFKFFPERYNNLIINDLR